MIFLTMAAKEQIDNHFKDKVTSPIRIYLNHGCGGPRFALALDEPTDGDEVVEDGGYKFVMEKELFKQASPLTVDMSPMGFVVQSEMELGGGGGGCSGCTSCG
ncbi:IscA/HesB family protein [Desulfocurvibacter africanus]|uniref:IscA/HesB family protein n=1 Tax=Desulfocurvibacter africanus TaxID=873 RepID=UPI00042667AC|nr:IscA/HesB family protein [Desulfocurvibacter africanus]